MIWSKWFKAPVANTEKTPIKTILEQMNEPRPLPMGVKDFEEWSDRIISGALIPTDDKQSLKGVLAAMLTALGPQEDHKPDAYFIHSLRKAATNEVARHMFQKIKTAKSPETDATSQPASADANRKNG